MKIINTTKTRGFYKTFCKNLINMTRTRVFLTKLFAKKLIINTTRTRGFYKTFCKNLTIGFYQTFLAKT
jgi:hypothetical protein